MLESFLQEPERLTNDDVMLVVDTHFHTGRTQELLKKLLEREKPETRQFYWKRNSPCQVGFVEFSILAGGCDFSAVMVCSKSNRGLHASPALALPPATLFVVVSGETLRASCSQPTK